MKPIFEVGDVFSIEGRGSVLTGKVTRRSITIGMRTFIRGGWHEVVGLEMLNKTLTTVQEGDRAGILLKSLEKANSVRGMTLEFE